MTEDGIVKSAAENATGTTDSDDSKKKESTLKPLGEKAKGVAGKITDGIKNAASKIGPTVTGAGKAAGEKIKEVGEKAKETVTGIADDIHADRERKEAEDRVDTRATEDARREADKVEEVEPYTPQEPSGRKQEQQTAGGQPEEGGVVAPPTPGGDIDPVKELGGEGSVTREDIEGEKGTQSEEATQMASVGPHAVASKVDEVVKREMKGKRVDDALNALIPTVGGIGAAVGSAGDVFGLTRRMVRGFVEGRASAGSALLVEALGDVDTASSSAKRLSEQYGIAAEADRKMLDGTLKGRILAARSDSQRRGIATGYVDLQRQLGALGKDVDNLSVQDIAQVVSVVSTRAEKMKQLMASPKATKADRDRAQGYLEFAQDIYSQLDKRNSEIGKLSRRMAAETNRTVTDVRRVNNAALGLGKVVRRNQLEASGYGKIVSDALGGKTDNMRFQEFQGSNGDTLYIPTTPTARQSLVGFLSEQKRLGQISPQDMPVVDEILSTTQTLMEMNKQGRKAQEAAMNFNDGTGVSGANKKIARDEAMQSMTSLFDEYGIEVTPDIMEQLEGYASGNIAGMLNDPMMDLLNDPRFMEKYRDYRAHDVQIRLDQVMSGLDKARKNLGWRSEDVASVGMLLKDLQMREWERSSANQRFDPEVYRAMDAALEYYNLMTSSDITTPVKSYDRQINDLLKDPDVSKEEREAKLDDLMAARRMLTDPAPGDSDWEQNLYDLQQGLLDSGTTTRVNNRQWSQEERERREENRKNRKEAAKQQAREERLVTGTMSRKEMDDEIARTVDSMTPIVDEMVRRAQAADPSFQGVSAKRILDMPMSDIRERYPELYRRLSQSTQFKAARQRYDVLKNQTRFKDASSIVDRLTSAGIMDNSSAMAWRDDLRRSLRTANSTLLNNPRVDAMGAPNDFTRACDYLEFMNSDAVREKRRSVSARREALGDDITGGMEIYLEDMEDLLTPVPQGSFNENTLDERKKLIAETEQRIEEEEARMAKEQLERMMPGSDFTKLNNRERDARKNEALDYMYAAMKDAFGGKLGKDEMFPTTLKDWSRLQSEYPEEFEKLKQDEKYAQAFSTLCAHQMTDDYIKLLNKVMKRTSPDSGPVAYGNLTGLLKEGLDAMVKDSGLWPSDTRFGGAIDDYGVVMDDKRRKALAAAVKQKKGVDLKTGKEWSAMADLLENPAWDNYEQISDLAEFMRAHEGMAPTPEPRASEDRKPPGNSRGQPRKTADLDNEYSRWVGALGQESADYMYKVLRPYQNKVAQIQSQGGAVNWMKILLREMNTMDNTPVNKEIAGYKMRLLRDKYVDRGGDVNAEGYVKVSDAYDEMYRQKFPSPTDQNNQIIALFENILAVTENTGRDVKDILKNIAREKGIGQEEMTKLLEGLKEYVKKNGGTEGAIGGGPEENEDGKGGDTGRGTGGRGRYERRRKSEDGTGGEPPIEEGEEEARAKAFAEDVKKLKAAHRFLGRDWDDSIADEVLKYNIKKQKDGKYSIRRTPKFADEDLKAAYALANIYGNDINRTHAALEGLGLKDASDKGLTPKQRKAIYRKYREQDLYGKDYASQKLREWMSGPEGPNLTPGQIQDYVGKVSDALDADDIFPRFASEQIPNRFRNTFDALQEYSEGLAPGDPMKDYIDRVLLTNRGGENYGLRDGAPREDPTWLEKAYSTIGNFMAGGEGVEAGLKNLLTPHRKGGAGETPVWKRLEDQTVSIPSFWSRIAKTRGWKEDR